MGLSRDVQFENLGKWIDIKNGYEGVNQLHTCKLHKWISNDTVPRTSHFGMKEKHVYLKRLGLMNTLWNDNAHQMQWCCKRKKVFVSMNF